jgi:hypothetical protein
VFRSRKQAKREAWAADAALYCTKVLEWHRVAAELPGMVKVKDHGARGILFAAEAARAHLASQREVLIRQAARLGLDGNLPEASWPSGRPVSQA